MTELTPTAQLSSEHQTILKVIAVLEHLDGLSEKDGCLQVDDLRRCVEFFQLFADACHHAKEEDLLFPVLESRGIPREGGPIGVMLYEHRLAREYTREMAGALDTVESGQTSAAERFHRAARAYIELLRAHIHKEDHVLFHMGDRFMSEDDRKDLCSKFCEVGCRAFWGKTREDLERLAGELEAKWLS